MEPLHYILAIAAGFLAGVVNTLAGSGSLFTLPFLLFLGLPAHIANGTNRIGILTQTIVGAFTLYKRGGTISSNNLVYIIPTVVGSFVGAMLAINIPESTLRIIIGIVMVLLLIIILMNYSNLLREINEPVSREKRILAFPLLFVIGVYGGFIQLGVGIFTLAALLLFLNFTFQNANILKNTMNFCLTVPALIVFAINGQVNWKVGFIIAIGQTFGAWVAARYASDNQNANKWIRRLLVVMTLITSLELFGILNWLKDIFL